ncbi:uncharacterized protein [Anoplolepis gracilipes]|uniref:uncharacterized protein n=1 Tax=Anoplolepis gracilipes TaxID=354296 RepID=UPI003BA218EB
MKNIEIKAKIIDNIDQVISKAKELSRNDGRIIKQHDIFFNATKSRLKLRKFENGTAELISYKRPDTKGLKISVYDKAFINTDDVNLIENILSSSIGVFGVVKKTRHIFIVERTRIHIDNVDHLGNFIELEVMMQSDDEMPDCDQQTAEKIAGNLMKALFINEENLIAEAYIDLLNHQNNLS